MPDVFETTFIRPADLRPTRKAKKRPKVIKRKCDHCPRWTASNACRYCLALIEAVKKGTL